MKTIAEIMYEHEKSIECVDNGPLMSGYEEKFLWHINRNLTTLVSLSEIIARGMEKHGDPVIRLSEDREARGVEGKSEK